MLRYIIFDYHLTTKNRKYIYLVIYKNVKVRFSLIVNDMIYPRINIPLTERLF